LAAFFLFAGIDYSPLSIRNRGGSVKGLRNFTYGSFILRIFLSKLFSRLRKFFSQVRVR